MSRLAWVLLGCALLYLSFLAVVYALMRQAAKSEALERAAKAKALHQAAQHWRTWEAKDHG